MAERVYVPIKLSQAGLDQVRELAEQETKGNISAMVRKLLGEAVEARQRRR